MSAPPVKKSKISKPDQEQLMAMYNLLPKEAQKEGYEGLSKSYTLIKDDALDHPKSVSSLTSKCTMSIQFKLSVRKIKT